MVEQALPGRRGFEHRASHQNRLPEPDFQRANALGDGRLAQPERKTGAFEPATLHDRRQGFQQFVVNHK